MKHSGRSHFVWARAGASVPCARGLGSSSGGSSPAALVILILAFCFPGSRGAAQEQPRSPADSAKLLQLADPTLKVELAACEPAIASPVAVAWDEHGFLYAAEMSDYPRSTNGGSIRRLEDRDHDGFYESSTVFARELPFPNAVLPWNGGLLVTAAPDLWFLKDTDGDGVADEKTRLYSGFGTGNQQLRANGLIWGIDNWVYGANGRSDGDIRWAGRDQPVSLRGRDFRFKPGTASSFETLVGRSQFGLGIDDWGHRFLSWNTIPLRHEVFPDRWLHAQSPLSPNELLADGLPPGDTGEVFPRTPPPLVFNNESGSHFNALSGLHIYRGHALGEAYRGNAFVGESLRNLVHRRALVPQGPTFLAQRMETGREFLASADPWFHPVNFATGPDGALYVVDFYRKFVEHPDWVAPEMRTRVSWDTGKEHGRLWRVTRKDRAADRQAPAPRLARATVPQLVRALEDPNGWTRDTAQRLLVQRQDKSARPLLERLLNEAVQPQPAVHAFHTLQGLDLLDAKLIETASRSKFAPLREQSLIEGLPVHRIDALTRDDAPRVRLRATLMLSTIADSDRREAAIDAVVRDHPDDRWLLMAAAASTRRTPIGWADQLRAQTPPLRPVPVPRGADPDRERVIERLKPALRLTGEPRHGAEIAARLCLACHYIQGHGRRVGPDLSGLAARPVETLLIDLLDPSRQIAPDYQAYEIAVAGAEPVTGIISSESATRITVRNGGGPDLSIPRHSIQSVRATGKSLMPDGLESGLGDQAFADLLAFLRNPNGDWLR